MSYSCVFTPKKIVVLLTEKGRYQPPKNSGDSFYFTLYVLCVCRPVPV